MKELSTIPGLEDAVIGVGRKSGFTSVCYSATRALSILQKSMGKDEAEFFLLQAQNTWAGESSPIIVFEGD